MKVVRHKLQGVSFVPTKNYSKNVVIDPIFITMHYTGGWSAADAIHAFKTRKVSAHLVLDRDGDLTQMIPFNKRAWHAGPSRFMGYSGLNSYSIGIEIVNIGYFKYVSEGVWMDGYGHKRTDDYLFAKGYDPKLMIKAKQPILGGGYYYWPMYTEAQLKKLDEIVDALDDAYNIKAINTHEEIDTRGWKTDPGPAFPMKRYKARINNGEREKDEEETYRIRVTTDKLNVREGAGPEWKAIGHLDKGMERTVLKTDGKWLLLYLGGQAGQGWVHGYYTERI